MGITSSTNSSTRNNQVPPEKLGDSENERPDSVKAIYMEKWMREMYALFSPKLGEPSKSGEETEREKEAEARYCEFMKRGGCKEAFTTLEDCVKVEEAGIRSNKCKECYLMMIKCMYSHYDYYQPILAVNESCEELLKKELDAFYARKQAS